MHSRALRYFACGDARDLCLLDPTTAFGPDFVFRHAFDERILEVRIVAAAADFFAEDGVWRYGRGREPKQVPGAALRHFKASEVRFRRGSTGILMLQDANDPTPSHSAPP